MKLIFCPDCEDIVKLRTEMSRYCFCGVSWGRYRDDGVSAIISGKAIPLGVANSSFTKALHQRPKHGSGSRFDSFVIPYDCPTVKKTT